MARDASNSELIEVRCESCGKTLKVGRTNIGRHGRCPSCQTKFLIREPKPKPERKPAPDKGASVEPEADLTAGEDDEEFEDTPSFAVVLPWWQNVLEHLKTSVPCWLVSLAAHAALLVLLALVTVTVPQRDKEGIQVNVQLKAEEDQKEVYLNKEDIQNRLDDLTPDRASAFADSAAPSAGIAPGLDTSGAVPVIGIAGSIHAGGGSPFAVARGPVSFFGSSGEEDTSSVIFVVDRSVSMEGERLKTAKEELLRSIRRLTVANMFNVIFFSDDQAHHACWPKMVLATTERKNQAYAFIEKTHAHGGTEPASALEQAIRSRPDLVFLLTDGEIYDKSIIDKVKELVIQNARGKKIRINTIAFKDRGGERMLRKIAAQNGGKYRFVR